MLQDSCFTPGITGLEETAREAGQNTYVYVYIYTHLYVYSTVCAELRGCSPFQFMSTMDPLLHLPEVRR